MDFITSEGCGWGVAAFVLKLSLDPRASNFPLFCSRRGRRDQCRCGRWELRGLSGTSVYGCAAGSSERDKHAGAMGGNHGQWRSLPHEAGYSPTGNDSTYCDQRDWRCRGRYSAHQNASADLSQSFAMDDVGRDVAFCLRQAVDRKHIRGHVGRGQPGLHGGSHNFRIGCGVV